MNKKKILVVAMSLAMVAILAIGGTIAYFTADEQVTNTMVIGNVDINIDEVVYKDGKFEKFENDKFVLYPIDNEQASTLYNKMVYTANTSTSKDAAYIRNIVLIEANEKVTANATDCCFPGVHYFYYNAAEPVTGSDGKVLYGSKEVGTTTETVKVNGKNYYVVVFVEAQERAIPYDAALYSLHSVSMDQDVTSEQIAGWGKDNKLDVIVFSQGIQAEGLTHEQAMTELGEVNETNLQSWLTGENKAETAKINDWTTKGNPTTEDETTGA